MQRQRMGMRLELKQKPTLTMQLKCGRAMTCGECLPDIDKIPVGAELRCSFKLTEINVNNILPKKKEYDDIYFI